MAERDLSTGNIFEINYDYKINCLIDHFEETVLKDDLTGKVSSPRIEFFTFPFQSLHLCCQ